MSSAFGEPGFIRTRDGRRLHRVIRGTGSPTVVFVAGLGATRGTWGLVQPVVGAVTRTIAYDRAGLGRSDPERSPHAFHRMLDDLEDLLSGDGRPPFVLVGHSLGGPLVRGLAHRRPDLVAGLVLVDPVDEGCEIFYRRVRNLWIRICFRLAAALAAWSLLPWLLGERLYRGYSPEAAAEVSAEELGPVAMRISAQELRCMPYGLHELTLTVRRDQPLEMPVTVISAGRCAPFESRTRPLLVARHREFAASLPQGRHVMAHNSAHRVPQHEPQIIIGETLRLVEACREN